MPVKVSQLIPTLLICVNLVSFRGINVNKCDVEQSLTETARAAVAEDEELQRAAFKCCVDDLPLAATQTVAEGDLWGAHASLHECVCTCARACV